MHYALLGDIHSSKEDLEKVLADITEKAPEAIVSELAICSNAQLVKEILQIRNLRSLKTS